MPYNGSGVFSVVYNFANDAANGIKILASRQDTQWNDVATNGLSNVICRDGQSTTTAAIPFAAGINITGGNFTFGGTAFVSTAGSGTQIQTGAAASQSVAALATSSTFVLPPGAGTFLLSDSGSFGNGANLYIYCNAAGTVGISLIKTVQAAGTTNINSVQAVANGFTVSNGNTSGNCAYDMNAVTGKLG